jgi:hypothetical protein
MPQTLFDSREYEWADITVVAGGRDLIGIRGITVGAKIEAEHLHAKGRHPHSVQTGNISPEGSLIVLQSEYEALVEAGGGSILNLRNLAVVVCFGNPSNGDVMKTKKVTGIQFTEEKVEGKQGDKFFEFTLPYLATRFDQS